MTIDNILLSKSAVFFTHNNAFASFDFAKSVKDIIADVSKKKFFLSSTEDEIQYFLVIFKKDNRQPAFFKEIDRLWTETKVGYFLILYNSKYAAIAKINTKIPKKIEEVLSPISPDYLINLKVDEDTEFKKIELQNLDGSDNAIRSKSYIAANLKNNLSTIGASSYYVRNLRGAQKKDSNKRDFFLISINTSRINDYSSKKGINDIQKWVKGIFDYFDSQQSICKQSFLSNFAKYELFDSLEKYKPFTILLYVNQILFDFVQDNDSIDEIKKNRIIEELQYFETANKPDIDKKENGYNLKFENGSVIILEYKKNKIFLKNDNWKKISFSINEVQTNLEKLINENNLFNVYFENLTSVYSNGYIFSNSKLLDSWESIVNFMESYKELGKTKCEKFEKKPQNDDDKSFYEDLYDWDKGSEFKFIEKNFKKMYDILICDDCNDEWADFIGISSKESTVSFFACKHKPTPKKGFSMSGSYLENVVAQSLKNIGNLSPSSNQLSLKEKQWNYNNSRYNGSEIKKYNGGKKKLRNQLDFWENNYFLPNFKKESCIVVNFIKKKDFKLQMNAVVEKLKKKEFYNLTNSEECAYQQLWILSSFICVCKEAGVIPRIICQ